VVLFGFFELLYYLSAQILCHFPEATSPFHQPRKTGPKFAEISKAKFAKTRRNYKILGNCYLLALLEKKNIFLFTKKQADV
jgi:hypothetical protein